jgi:hypothetical protein
MMLPSVFLLFFQMLKRDAFQTWPEVTMPRFSSNVWRPRAPKKPKRSLIGTRTAKPFASRTSLPSSSTMTTDGGMGCST